ncbi:MAG: 1-deoxy-D-xylulose-5-phosphate synthase N-terminal domain-containing protein [Planctomycetota bacterium]|jgi:transketolase
MIPDCKKIRKSILSIAKESGHGHVPTCFSVVEILYAIYNTIRHNPDDPSWDQRDIFILSKGHASLAHYTVLANFGYFDTQQVYSYGSFATDFGCHADKLKVPGIEASTGSLGHGIGLAVGMALAFKIEKNSRKVCVLIGDGESNEGSVWEATMVATNLKLNNLTIIYDNNMSHSRGLQIQNPAERFKSFGCRVSEADGHDVDVLKSEISGNGDMVRAIVANTKKGYGCHTLIDNQYQWHRKSPTESEFEMLIGELDEETV